MIPHLSAETLLERHVQLVERIPTPPPPARRCRGRPPFYADQFFLKALVILIVKHLHSPYELLTVLQQDSTESVALRPLLLQAGRFASWRNWERRLAALPAQIRCLGCLLVERI